ncbi:MAG: chemotaxis protein CheW, partial [Leptospiraceae bacterium]|nr:chemotaxis protein CheW [Leptospiraceae bacterium]
QLVTFLIGMEEYGFSIQTVEEILRVSKITEVPDAPSYVLGLLSLRNNLLPIIDLRKLFKMSSLVDNKIQEIEKHINSYRTWLSNFEFSLKNDTNQFKPIDSLKAMKWIESFRTSSENIGKILQTVKFTHQELSYQSGTIFGLKNEQSAESIQELFDTRITISFNRLITKLEECKEALLFELKEDQRILVIDLNNQSIGIMVDRMQQVIRVPENLIDPPPGIIHGDKKDNLQGIVKLDSGNRLILLIDELRLFSEDIMNSLKKMDSVNNTNEEEKVVGEENLDRDEGQLVTFRLGKEEFGIFIEDVREINRLTGITAVPNAPSFVEGIMNLRGNVIPAVDLRKRFGLESIQHGESTRVIIVDIEEKTTGLIVDSVSDVIRISRSLIESPPEVISSKVETEFIQGIGNLVKQNRFIIILNVNKILSGSEKEQLSSVSSEM